MVRYSVVWMGPLNREWIEENGAHWYTGRIDVDGADEPVAYRLAPMHKGDWYWLSQWLLKMRTQDVWTCNELLEGFEQWYGKEIRWAL